MRLKNPLHFAVLDDPFLDLFGENGDLTQLAAFRYAPASAPQTRFPVDDDAIGKLSDLVGARHAALGAPTIQDPEVVVTPVDPSPAGGAPIQDPDVVIVPPAEPPVQGPPVQDPAVLPISPAPSTIVPLLLGGAAVPEQAAASISEVVGPQHAVGATPPIQDPDVVIVPPVNPNPGAGPPIQDPDVVIVPPAEPPVQRPPVQDSAVLPISPAPPAIAPGAAVPYQPAASISEIVGPQHAVGATPPIQDPDVVVVPPLDPNPGGGSPIQDPDVIVPTPPEPPADHPTVQDTAFVSVPPPPALSGPGLFGGFAAAAPSLEAGAVPIAAADWWLVG